jgi:hypothetical protein
MANPGFFNANQHRDYPFAPRVSPLLEEGWSSSASESATELPQECIVDFGAILRPSAEFETASDFVYLRSVARSGTVLTITLAASNLPTAYGITFDIDTATVPEFYTQWQDSDILATDSVLAECDDSPVWSAYLVTGDLSPWLDQLADGDTLIFVTGLWQIMQARLQNLAGTQVQSVTIANIPRAVAAAAGDCGTGSAAAADPQVARLVYNCMVGDIKLHEGFNCGMRYDLRDNAIVISASPGAGAGAVCEDFPSYPEEEKPAGSPYYSGGPACRDIVKYINGASAADFKITAGAGFTITADADNSNTLIIERSLNASVICADPTLDGDGVWLSSASAGAP